MRDFYRSRQRMAVFLFVVGVLGGFQSVHASGDHEHHSVHVTSPEAAAKEASPRTVPQLKILMPESGDIVGTELAVVLETSADLAKTTMSAPVVGIHLHLQCDDVVVMPVAQQLVRLGKNRYLYVFDLPVTAGPKTLRAYWSDSMHNTITKSMQAVGVTVAPAVEP